MTEPGLCRLCVHARIVENDRGSLFWLCTAAATHPGLARYPALPVLRCPGFEPGARPAPLTPPEP